jgi:hypothetical protein
VVMPGGMNGAKLAVEARRIRPDLKVLLTSGFTASALSENHGLPDTLEVLPKPSRRGIGTKAAAGHLEWKRGDKCSCSGKRLIAIGPVKSTPLRLMPCFSNVGRLR